MNDNNKNGQGQGQENNPANFANDRERASREGRKGGRASQQSGNAHQLTDEERRRGGQIGGSK